MLPPKAPVISYKNSKSLRDNEFKKSNVDDDDDVVVETVYVNLRPHSVEPTAKSSPDGFSSIPLPTPAWNWVCIPDEDDVTNQKRLFCFESVCLDGRLEIRKSLQVDCRKNEPAGQFSGSVVYSLFGARVNKSHLLKTEFSDRNELAEIIRNYHLLAKVRKRPAPPTKASDSDPSPAAKKAAPSPAVIVRKQSTTVSSKKSPPPAPLSSRPIVLNAANK